MSYVDEAQPNWRQKLDSITQPKPPPAAPQQQAIALPQIDVGGNQPPRPEGNVSPQPQGAPPDASGQPPPAPPQPGQNNGWRGMLDSLAEGLNPISPAEAK